MSLIAKLVAFVKREPVAAYGGVVATALTVLTLLGVPATDVETITGVLIALGVPVTRSKVTPTSKPKA